MKKNNEQANDFFYFSFKINVKPLWIECNNKIQFNVREMEFEFKMFIISGERSRDWIDASNGHRQAIYAIHDKHIDHDTSI